MGPGRPDWGEITQTPVRVLDITKWILITSYSACTKHFADKMGNIVLALYWLVYVKYLLELVVIAVYKATEIQR